jgi:hypothetical protein
MCTVLLLPVGYATAVIAFIIPNSLMKIKGGNETWSKARINLELYQTANWIVCLLNMSD